MTSRAVGQGGPYSAAALSGAGAPPPVDALHPDGRRPDARRPGHRPRRGLLRLRRRRQALPRRPLGAVLRRTSATAAPSSPRPPPSRRASSTSSRSGATPTRARSSSPTRIAALAPGDLNRVFFTSGGSEAVESALEARPQATTACTGQAASGQGDRREIAYHGTSHGRAVGDRHHRAAHAVRAARARRLHVPNTNFYRWPRGPRPAVGGRRRSTERDPVRGPRDGRRGDPRAGPERRRLLPAAGRATSSACARSATATACC